jgi:Lon protease-like protein
VRNGTYPSRVPWAKSGTYLRRAYPDTMTRSEDQWPATRAVTPAFIGMSRPDAELRAHELGLVLRIVDWDELGDGPVAIAMTSDLRFNRVTLHVRSGLVTAAEAG